MDITSFTHVPLYYRSKHILSKLSLHALNCLITRFEQITRTFSSSSYNTPIISWNEQMVSQDIAICKKQRQQCISEVISPILTPQEKLDCEEIVKYIDDNFHLFKKLGIREKSGVIVSLAADLEFLQEKMQEINNRLYIEVLNFSKELFCALNPMLKKQFVQYVLAKLNNNSTYYEHIDNVDRQKVTNKIIYMIKGSIPVDFAVIEEFYSFLPITAGEATALMSQEYLEIKIQDCVNKLCTTYDPWCFFMRFGLIGDAITHLSRLTYGDRYIVVRLRKNVLTLLEEYSLAYKILNDREFHNEQKVLMMNSCNELSYCKIEEMKRNIIAKQAISTLEEIIVYAENHIKYILNKECLEKEERQYRDVLVAQDLEERKALCYDFIQSKIKIECRLEFISKLLNKPGILLEIQGKESHTELKYSNLIKCDNCSIVFVECHCSVALSRKDGRDFRGSLETNLISLIQSILLDKDACVNLLCIGSDWFALVIIVSKLQHLGYKNFDIVNIDIKPCKENRKKLPIILKEKQATEVIHVFDDKQFLIFLKWLYPHIDINLTCCMTAPVTSKFGPMFIFSEDLGGDELVKISGWQQELRKSLPNKQLHWLFLDRNTQYEHIYTKTQPAAQSQSPNIKLQVT